MSEEPEDTPMDAQETWLPIYVTLVLSLGQVMLFLIIFECSRRSRSVGDVYDRRRLVWPNRVPPPLMQKRGWLKGYLGFEWFRLKCSNPEYNKLAEREHQQLVRLQQNINKDPKQQQQSQQNANSRVTETSLRSIQPTNKLNRSKQKVFQRSNKRTKKQSDNVDSFLIQAEQQCLQESPFYFPKEDGKQEKPVIFDDNDHDNLVDEDDNLVNEEKEEEQEDDENPPPHHDSNSSTTTPLSTPIVAVPPKRTGSGSILRNASGGSTSIDNNQQRPPAGDNIIAGDDKLRDITKANTTSPLSISKKLVRFTSNKLPTSPPSSASKRQVSTGEVSSTSASSDSRKLPKPAEHVPFGSPEGEQWARMRYYTQDNEQWDVQALNAVSQAISKFFQKRVWKNESNPHHHEDDDDDEHKNNADSTTLEGEEKIESGTARPEDKQHKGRSTTVSRKVARRPLSKEQAEVLRCVGLDGFMMLRFLQFGFAIAFWPLLMACIVLIPTYKTGNGGEIGYFSVTVTNVIDESGKLWLIVLYGYLQIVFILRRLWVEWELFLPLRNDFLERGDFVHSKYEDQVR